MRVNKIILFLSILFFAVQLSFGSQVNLTEYEYHTKIDVDCDKYRGFIEMEAPPELVSLINDWKDVNIYMNAENYYLKAGRGEKMSYYYIQPNWYVNEVLDYEVEMVERIYDNIDSTDLIVENETSINLNFKNPDLKQIKKITIYAKDSIINDVEINANGNMVQSSSKREGFFYEINLKDKVFTDDINLKISFEDNIVKLNEIRFFKEELIVDNTKIYFYNKEQCGNTYNLFFGRYGKDYSKSGEVGVAFDPLLDIETNPNSLYDNDFDSDGVENDFDNCLYASNPDQEDINYNQIGDVCEDFDSDRVMNNIDNCVETYNPDQFDSDSDGVGNACDNSDGRFFEQNKSGVYLILVLIVIAFGILAYFIVKK